jgi:hypothetical protein
MNYRDTVQEGLDVPRIDLIMPASFCKCCLVFPFAPLSHRFYRRYTVSYSTSCGSPELALLWSSFFLRRVTLWCKLLAQTFLKIFTL